MQTVSADEAKTRLPHLLDEVERGETVTITRGGKPVARLEPAADDQRNGDFARESTATGHLYLARREGIALATLDDRLPEAVAR